MRHSSAREGQVEPFAALAAVVVVAFALAAYAGAFESAVPSPLERTVADPAADQVERAVTVGGVVDPDRIAGVNRSGPRGYRTNVTLDYGGNRVTTGPAAPNTTELARRHVSVGLNPGVVVPGRLEVRVWT